FAVLFDDIPSRLTYEQDRRRFAGSLARAEGQWLADILARQPAFWEDVEWRICPSYYSKDPLLAGGIGRFERNFLERLSETLHKSVACLGTGQQIVSKKITAAHIRHIRRSIDRRLIIWDNYPVNDLSMSAQMHLGPLQGRAPDLPEVVYGYLNNPLLQEALSFIPLATCFDYAGRPDTYDPEKSWRRAIEQQFVPDALPYWVAIREFCEREMRRKNKTIAPRWNPREARRFQAALDYLRRHRRKPWARELQPWTHRLQKRLTADMP